MLQTLVSKPACSTPSVSLDLQECESEERMKGWRIMSYKEDYTDSKKIGEKSLCDTVTKWVDSKNLAWGDFPGGPVVGTVLPSGEEFDPWVGNQDPSGFAVWHPSWDILREQHRFLNILCLGFLWGQWEYYLKVSWKLNKLLQDTLNSAWDTVCTICKCLLLLLLDSSDTWEIMIMCRGGCDFIWIVPEGISWTSGWEWQQPWLWLKDEIRPGQWGLVSTRAWNFS